MNKDSSGWQGISRRSQSRGVQASPAHGLCRAGVVMARRLKPAAPTELPGAVRAVGVVSRSINTMTFADRACEARSRSEEEVMQGHLRRRETQRSSATSISPKGGGGTASISLSLRQLDAVALATNVTIFMERGTYPRARSEDWEQRYL